MINRYTNNAINRNYQRDNVSGVISLFISLFLELLCKPRSDNLVNYLIVSLEQRRAGFV